MSSPTGPAVLNPNAPTRAPGGAPPAAPVPPFAWANGYQGMTPPWSWANLDADEAEELDERLGEFIGDYNTTFVVRLDDVIPGCWRQHPSLYQRLPVLFYGYWWTHRAEAAKVEEAAGWYERHLWMFQERLPDMLGKGRMQCLKGHHMGERDAEVSVAVGTAESADAVQVGPNVLDVLRKTRFGS